MAANSFETYAYFSIMAEDLESCHVELPSSSGEKDSLAQQTSAELRGVLNLVSGSISAPSSLSDSDEGGSTHYSMPSREYIASKEFVLLYFSAGWCPPCRVLSPVLSKWAKKNKDEVGVVFVSHDRSEAEMMSFVKDKHFAFMPFRDKTFGTLNQILSVSMLPTVVVVSRETGRVVTHWGRSAVEKNPDGCVEEWRQGRSGVSWLSFCTIS